MEANSKYAYEVYKKGSFSKAAKALYISQPSLSAAISRLEGELGFRIFDRTTIPSSLTAEGRIYIESLEEIIESENNMKKKIKELSDVNHGSITVGGSNYASYLILSEICGAFYKKHPKTSVKLDIGNVGTPRVLVEKLDNKEIDVLVTYTDLGPKYVVETICEERLVIAMHKDIPTAKNLMHLATSRDAILSNTYSPECEIADCSIFRDVEFIDFSARSDTGVRMHKIINDYKHSRYEIRNSRHSEMHYNLMTAGIGALLTNTLAIAQKPYDENILFFLPKHEESYRKVYLTYNVSSKNNPIIKNFIAVAKEVFK